jgi:hypothetical protein
MKSIKLLVAAVLAAMAVGAQAADTNTLTINGTITPVCKFNIPAETLAITLDATLATPSVSTQTISYWCTKGTTAIFAPNTGLHPAGVVNQLKQAAAANFIAYTIGVAGGGAGTGKGTPLTATATITIANAAYVNADATAPYSDQVIITLTP